MREVDVALYAEVRWKTLLIDSFFDLLLVDWMGELPGASF